MQLSDAESSKNMTKRQDFFQFLRNIKYAVCWHQHQLLLTDQTVLARSEFKVMQESDAKGARVSYTKENLAYLINVLLSASQS